MTTIVPNRQRVILIRQRNPCLPLSGIGRAVGLTRERVRQILAKAGQPTRALRLPAEMVPLTCDNCGKRFERRQSSVLSIVTRPHYQGKWVSCSPACSGVLRSHFPPSRLGYRKPFCKRGHPRTPDNLYGRNCRICNLAMQAERWKNLKARKASRGVA